MTALRNTRLVAFEDLQAITGLTRAGDVMRCLRTQGIAVFYGKGGVPWTTIDLINKAGGLVHGDSTNEEKYGAEICEPYPLEIFR